MIRKYSFTTEERKKSAIESLREEFEEANSLIESQKKEIIRLTEKVAKEVDESKKKDNRIK